MLINVDIYSDISRSWCEGSQDFGRLGLVKKRGNAPEMAQLAQYKKKETVFKPNKTNSYKKVKLNIQRELETSQNFTFRPLMHHQLAGVKT